MLGRPLALTWRADVLRSTFDVPRDMYMNAYRTYLRNTNNPTFQDLTTRDAVIVIKNGTISRRRGPSRSSSKLYSTYGDSL